MLAHPPALPDIGLYKALEYAHQARVARLFDELGDLIVILNRGDEGADIQRQPCPEVESFSPEKAFVFISTNEGVHEEEDRQSETRKSRNAF
jgi:hypothetical protein